MPHIPAEERRRQLVEAALRVIAKVGLDAAGTRQIAAEAGAPLSSLHYAFRDKNELLASVYQYLVDRDAAILETAIPAGCGLETGVRTLTLDFVEGMFDDEPNMMANYQIFFWSVSTPTYNAVANQAYAKYRELCVAALQRAADGKLPDDKAVAMVGFLMNAIDGVVLQYMAQRDRVAARANLEVFAAIALDRFA